MSFDTLLGNDTIKARLSSALSNRRLSHCFLITGPVGSGKHTLARLLSAAMQCTQETKPCLQCSQCRKVLDGMHPDIIHVTDSDRKAVSVKIVREACADLYIRPNEGNRKIYLFDQELNPQGQNALLKSIEEPPPYGSFLLLTQHAEQMLPTIRSRCVELRLSPLPEGLLRTELSKRFPKADAEAITSAILRSGGYLGQAVTLLEESAALLPQSQTLTQALCGGTETALLRLLVSMENLKRDQLRPVLQEWYRLLSSAAACQRGMPPICPEAKKIANSRSSAALLSMLDSLRHAMELLEANVGGKHICGMLTVTLNQH